jgi:hypothetical protein
MTFVAERNSILARKQECLGQRVSGIKRLNNAEIGVFGDQPAPRAQRRRHAPQYVSGIIHVHQERPAVNEIVCGWLDVILRDVAAAHLHVRRAQIAEKPRIQIDRDDPPSATHPLGKPAHHRASASADLQTTPALPDTDTVETSEGPRIAQCLQQLQASQFVVRLGIGREVAATFCGIGRHHSLPSRLVTSQS